MNTRKHYSIRTTGRTQQIRRHQLREEFYPRFALDDPIPQQFQRGYVNPYLPFWIQQECRFIACLGEEGFFGKFIIWCYLFYLVGTGLVMSLMSIIDYITSRQFY